MMISSAKEHTMPTTSTDRSRDHERCVTHGTRSHPTTESTMAKKNETESVRGALCATSAGSYAVYVLSALCARIRGVLASGVPVTYDRGSDPVQAVVRLERPDGTWKVTVFRGRSAAAILRTAKRAYPEAKAIIVSRLLR